MARKFDKYDHLSPLDAVVAAWSNPGRVPIYHAYMQSRLEREWPLLARALYRLVQEENAATPEAADGPTDQEGEKGERR